MATDKKVTELPALSGDVQLTDILLGVRSNVDYQFTAQQLINLIAATIAVGSSVTFRTDIPPNTDGKNGDVVVKTDTGQFYQKAAGTWVVRYTVPAAGSGNTVRYGSGAPNDATGVNGDTYINTDAGTFYLKSAGTYTIKFSMATGPAGATGSSGANGTNGANGKTILNGTTPPSNTTDGTDGDFYINTAALYIYGPKAGGVWPAGVSITGDGPKFSQAYDYNTTDGRFIYDATSYLLTFALLPEDQILFPYSPLNNILDVRIQQKVSSFDFKNKNSFDYNITNNGANYQTVVIEGYTEDPTGILRIVLS